MRACYAALHMRQSVKQHPEGVRRSHGIEMQIRVGLNSGEVVVVSIGSDLHMDYIAVGQTTHLAVPSPVDSDPTGAHSRSNFPASVLALLVAIWIKLARERHRPLTATIGHRHRWGVCVLSEHQES